MNAWKRPVELFVYGSLRPGHKPPLSMKGYVEDSVEGYLVKTLPYPMLRHEPGHKHWVKGYTMLVHPNELPALDRYEGKEYKRIKVTTFLGFEAYVYVSKSAIQE